MKTIKQFNFTIVDSVCVMIKSDSLSSASQAFKNIFGEFLFSQVKYIEIC